MKLNTKSGENVFKPVKFTIEVETMDELLVLQAMFNTTRQKILEQSQAQLREGNPTITNMPYPLYAMVTDVVDKRMK